jgi:NADPH-dependent curcumin reductase
MPTYVEPVAIGAVMRAGTVGEVVTSRHPDFRQGDYVSDVAGNIGFQDYGVSDGAGLLKVDGNAVSLHSYAGGLGLNGFTAYFGLLEVDGQSPEKLCWFQARQERRDRWRGRSQASKDVERSALPAVLKNADLCARFSDSTTLLTTKPQNRPRRFPQPVRGSRCFFDHVGGSTLDAALMRLNRYGRIVVCGTMSQSGSTPEAVRAHLGTRTDGRLHRV